MDNIVSIENIEERLYDEILLLNSSEVKKKFKNSLANI
jgi:hypothetical protein